jgi:sugar phosphate isomerase/epimerase
MHHLALAPTSLPDTPPLEFIDAAAAAGLDGIGLRLYRSPILPFHPVVGNPALIAEIKRRLADANLKVLDILSFYLQAQMAFDQIRPALELGAELGAKYAMVIGDDTEWARMRDNFGRMCDAAAAFGLGVSIETAIMRPVATLEHATQIIAESGRSNAVLCLDPLNLIRAGGTIDAVRRLDPRLLPYSQLSDGLLGPGEPGLEKARQNGASERRLAGEGVLPLGELLEALPPNVPLSLEFPPPKGSTIAAADWARRVADTTRALLKKHNHF